ncbi:putative flagellar protein export ATPase FliI [Magnetofaba australis IT-1]|uniref:Putative flagellar protein export ATPase FliI n=1 Tax=Magnetofaba australis IT-1 TaxID=1434232 RepID=A0A1Y2K0B0_9PROT|nr:putative flagellar protein export ATPase FliI [Magnetofaba australis IT-1]
MARESLGPHRLGWVNQVVGLLIEGRGPAVSIGEMCHVIPEHGQPIKAEVVGFRDQATLLMPLGPLKGVYPGARIVSLGQAEKVEVDNALLGRVIGPMGEPLDGRAMPHLEHRVPLHAEPINPMQRKKIVEPLDLGVRAVNGLLTVGRGQRVGIFAGSGVGKSTLLGMMARYTEADINVIALIGERGREVVEFLERDLGPEGMKKSICVVATSDQPPLLRLRAAFMATSIAEFFRHQGKNVLLLMDSVTRFAMAQREVGLATGEPPTSRGYPPSTFMLLPRLLERAGRDEGPGSITGLYTVLMEGDDIQDPIVDAVRGILDGHILLSRDLAAANHYPPIDILGSLSRLMEDLAERGHKSSAGQLREILATYAKAEDMVNIGAYASGSNPKIDRALQFIDAARDYLKQPIDEQATLPQSVERLVALLPPV